MKGWAEAFLPGDRAPLPGEVFVQPDLCRTLKRISEAGADEFYSGSIAERIVSFSEENGGLLAREDLEGYRAEVIEPLRTGYREFDVLEQPPVSQGHILLEELNIVEGYDLASLGPRSPEAVHLLVEAMKLSFSDRHAHSGDPRFVKIPIDRILSKEHAARRRELIDPERAQAVYPPGSFEDGDTTYFAIADGDGNAVSFIQSLFHGFGSGVVVPGTGLLLNNRMTGFSLEPSSPNCVGGGKRTMHTLNTYMVFHDGRPLFIGGTPGGDKQVQTNLQIITRLLDWGMNVQEAAEHPRWAGAGGSDLVIEARYPRGTIARLREMGHGAQLTGPWSGSGAVQLIMIHPDTGALIGGSDPRCDGCSIGL
jgi:gamma-glutamyltranspeptidase/glutathione hydrolase